MTFLTIAGAADLILSGGTSCAEVVSASLARAEATERLNCMATVVGERAMGMAAALDGMLSVGVSLGPLHGIPIAVKDCIDTARIATTAGSPIEAQRIPERDATVVTRAVRAGSVVVGKTNLAEWAFGAPGEGASSLFGDVSNPWDETRTSGASSSGSAVAVAAGIVPSAIGTDLGGSVRLPAAFNGVFGLKPTWGRISRAGVIPNASTMDHVGLLTRNAYDAALVLDAVAGPDVADPCSLGQPFVAEFAAKTQRGIDGLRVGKYRLQADEDLDPSISDALDNTASVLSALGCSIQEIDLPPLADVRMAHWIVSTSEMAEWHRSRLQMFGSEYNRSVRRRLLAGESIPATDYVRAQHMRAYYASRVDRLFETVELMLLPTCADLAWPLERTSIGLAESRARRYTRYTALFNLTGHPAASVPTGVAGGLPVAVQFVGPLWREDVILRAAHSVELARGAMPYPWHSFPREKDHNGKNPHRQP